MRGGRAAPTESGWEVEDVFGQGSLWVAMYQLGMVRREGRVVRNAKRQADMNAAAGTLCQCFGAAEFNDSAFGLASSLFITTTFELVTNAESGDALSNG